jgi:hypothetical protein
MRDPTFTGEMWSRFLLTCAGDRVRSTRHLGVRGRQVGQGGTISGMARRMVMTYARSLDVLRVRYDADTAESRLDYRSRHALLQEDW